MSAVTLIQHANQSTTELQTKYCDGCMQQVMQRLSRFKGVPLHAGTIRVFFVTISRVAHAHSPSSTATPA